MEHIRKIFIEPDGVILQTQDGSNILRERKHDGLTEAYLREGQRGLDLGVFKMLCGGLYFEGRHRSTARYRRSLREAGHLSRDFDTGWLQSCYTAATAPGTSTKTTKTRPP